MTAEHKKYVRNAGLSTPHTLRYFQINPAASRHSDVPAARKLCGFLGHGAKRGCSKCKKEFIPGKHFGDKMNFGGFEN